MTEEDDLFQYWLMDMDDAIERFTSSVPERIRTRLDFSGESLSAVEEYALGEYADIDEVRKPTEAKKLDGMTRYVGEVFRKHFGGKWMIDFSDRKNLFYGRPQLTGMAGQKAQVSPMSLVTASLDRRTGTFIKKVFESCREDAVHSRVNR